MLKRVDFDQRLAPIYHDARRLNPETARTWMDEVRRVAPGPGPLRVLDLGSGTGRYSPLLADEFNGLVTAVEPARGMREQARLRSGHPSVSYVAAAAENLPLATESIDIAFAFMIWHHVADRHRATVEVARVLRPDGMFFCAPTSPIAFLISPISDGGPKRATSRGNSSSRLTRSPRNSLPPA